MRTPTSKPRCLSLAVFLGACTLALTIASPALAQAPSWQIGSETVPTDLPPGGEGQLLIVLSNLGDAPIEGANSPVTFTDRLPPGVSATSISGELKNHAQVECALAALTCTFKGVLYPYEQTTVTIKVRVPSGAAGSQRDQASAEGGGAAKASRTLTIPMSDEPAGFGPASFEMSPLNEDGTPDMNAGSHPFELTTTLVLDQTAGREPVALPRDLRFDLPPGLIGNPNAVSQCAMADFFALVDEANLCPPNSVVGVASVVAFEPLIPSKEISVTVPVFNLVPAQGEPARFGFEVAGKIPIVIDTSVRTGQDYGVDATVQDATETGGVLRSQLTLWGVPGDSRHNSSRGWECVDGGMFQIRVKKICPATSEEPDAPFLTLPTSCTTDPQAEPVRFSMETDSWANPGSFLGDEYAWMNEEGQLLGFTGCEALPFTPSIEVSPEQHTASTATGVEVDVKVPQKTTLEANGLAEADVRNTTVTLPAGLQLNPSAANGLQACTEAQVGFEGFTPGADIQQFSTTKPECPKASKLGSVHIKTPLLSHELEGWLYLAEPAPNGEAGRNPFDSLVAVYLVAEDPVSGVLVKLAGEGHLDESTGQISTTFDNAPQVPFEELHVDLFGGERASASTPAFCGAYPSAALFTPWSNTGQVSASSPAAEFEVLAGVGGGGCPGGSQGFGPLFKAGSADANAGVFTSFTVTLERADGQQQFSGLSVDLPQGIAALLSSVTPCAEPPAGVEWSCGEGSLIGHSTALAGLGGHPVSLGGNVYLTTGYDGAPFGLLVQTRAQAGPFDLGNVNVRSRIDVDPTTAAVSITTEPGPRDEALPAIIRGIPAQIKAIVVNVDRPDFEFNPTNCASKEIEGTIDGAERALATVSVHFQVENCQSLPFGPRLSASAVGHGSKAQGTTFRVTVSSGGVNGAGVAQAGIAKVDLQLPKQLSSRLPTLQKACTEAAFNANPASCDEGSVIGYATIHTPVLKTPLSGPAYLVSHGNAAFPDVEFVLQGEGIKLILDGKTQIKSGITYSKFESTPDAPFTTFETVLPAGPHGVLTPNVAESKHFDLCGEKLVMPTTMEGQNGDVLEQNTKITIEGCAAVESSHLKKLTRAQRLARALKACRRKHKHSRRERIRCERLAQKRYTSGRHANEHKKAVQKRKGRSGRALR